MCAFICIMAVIGKASRCKCSGSTDDSVIDRFPAASQQHTFQPLLFAFPQRKEVTMRFIDGGDQQIFHGTRTHPFPTRQCCPVKLMRL